MHLLLDRQIFEALMIRNIVISTNKYQLEHHYCFYIKIATFKALNILPRESNITGDTMNEKVFNTCKIKTPESTEFND